MINMEGRILWSTESLPQQLFSCRVPYSPVWVWSGHCPCVRLEKQTITVLEADTGKLVKVCDVGGRQPQGLTVDDNGNVFVCYYPGEIRVWSRNMEERSLTIHGKLEFNPWQ